MQPSGEEFSRLQRQIDSLQEAHDAFISIEASAALRPGDAYFEALVTGLAGALQVACVCVAELVRDEPHTAETRALYFDGAMLPQIRYDLRNTPCEDVFSSRACVYVTGVREQFPDDRLLEDWDIESYLGTPLFDAAGEPIGLLSAMDRHPLADPRLARMLMSLFASNAAGELQRRAAEMARSETEHRLRLAFDAASMGAWEWDLVARRVSYSDNLEAVLGIDPAGMPRDSRALLGIVHPDDRGQVAAAVMRSVIDREQFSIELRIEARKGEWRWIASRGHAYYGQDLRATRLVGVVNRIDDRLRAEEERRQLESRVQQAQKLETLATLAGGVAHDFNNLLQAINSNVELARSVMRPNEEIDAYLTQIEAASDRAGELTDQLLSYAGRRRIAWESIDLSRLTLEMSQLLEASIAKRARLLGQFAANLPPVLGDPTQLRQILLNLIVNAAESLPGGGSEIRLKTGTTHLDRQQLARIQASVELFEGNYVFLEVADTGCGMPPEVQSRIFDPFFTTKATGRGLGLAAVLGITCSHAGGVGVESAPGEGTTIRIYLPPAPGHLQAPAATHAREAEPAVPDVIEKTVLVVDDDAFVLESARLLLESIGFATISARSGREALEIFDSQQQTIHVVLLDLTMPGVSGDAVLRELRKRAPELPIVLCSGFSEEDAGRLPIHDGISLFLQKPFRSSELRQKLHAVLEAAGGLERHSPPAE